MDFEYVWKIRIKRESERKERRGVEGNKSKIIKDRS